MYANLEAYSEEHIVWKKTAAKNWTTEHTRMVIRLLKNVCSLFFFLPFFTVMCIFMYMQ